MCFRCLLQQRANEVTDIARDNIRMSIAQVETLQDMEANAQQLQDSSDGFYRGASKVRRMMCLRSWKMLALVIVLVVIFLIIIIVPIVTTLKKQAGL